MSVIFLYTCYNPVEFDGIRARILALTEEQEAGR